MFFLFKSLKLDNTLCTLKSQNSVFEIYYYHVTYYFPGVSHFKSVSVYLLPLPVVSNQEGVLYLGKEFLVSLFTNQEFHVV